MRKLALSLIAGVALSGCVSAPESPWNDITVDQSPAAKKVDCGSFPYPTVVLDTDGDGELDTIQYDEAGQNDLEAYRVCAEANGLIVDEHALQIGQLKRSRTALVDAGRAQRNIADMRQEMLEDERKHHFWQSLGLYAIIIGLAL